MTNTVQPELEIEDMLAAIRARRKELATIKNRDVHPIQTKFMQDKNYAHVEMELRFPATIDMSHEKTEIEVVATLRGNKQVTDSRNVGILEVDVAQFVAKTGTEKVWTCIDIAHQAHGFDTTHTIVPSTAVHLDINGDTIVAARWVIQKTTARRSPKQDSFLNGCGTCQKAVSSFGTDMVILTGKDQLGKDRLKRFEGVLK